LKTTCFTFVKFNINSIDKMFNLTH
jgi:hypothetical protein